MALTVHCPKCRAPMRVDEKHLGQKGRCSKCGEVFTLTAPNAAPEAPAKPPAAPPLHNPFANPFGVAPEPTHEPPDASPESGAGFFAFPFARPATPAPPPPASPPPAAPPPAPPAVTKSPFDPFPTAPEPPRPEPAPKPPAPTWSPFTAVEETAVETSIPTIELIPELPPPAPMYTPSQEPAPVVLEMSPPAQAPLLEHKIATVETFVVKLAGKRTLRGPHAPLIREGKATTRLFVKITSSAGDAAGWGEANPLLALQGATVESASALIRRFLRPAVEGATLADVNGWLRRLERAAPADVGPAAVAKAAVESALLDLLTRTLDAPLHIVWGGARTRSAAVAYPLDAENPKTIGDQMKKGRDRGATAFHLLLDGQETKDRHALSAVKGLASGSAFSVGFLRGHARDTALRLLAAGESAGATALHGLLAAESPSELARLAERARVPVLADAGPCDILELIHSGVGGVVLRPAVLGWRKAWTVALTAQAAGVRVWLGLQHEGALGLATAAHLAAALGIDAPILDAGRIYSETHFLTETDGDGPVKVDDAPGTGVTVDETLLRAAAIESG